MESLNLSYWEKASFYTSDVLIVGAGIVGLTAAIKLKKEQPKLTVTILERGFLPSGASTKNAGFACFGSVSELIDQEKRCGTNILHQLIKKRWIGLQKLRLLVGDRRLDLQINGGFELFKPSESTLSDECVSKISHFNEILRDITNEKYVFNISNSKIETFGFEGIDCLIENRLEAQLDPGKMVKALLELASSLGISILNNCTVNHFAEESNSVAISTTQGILKVENYCFAPMHLQINYYLI